VASAVSPRALPRKKVRLFIIAVISPVIQNRNAITTPLNPGVQQKMCASDIPACVRVCRVREWCGLVFTAAIQARRT
jgi:hypothetical protein